MTLEKTAYPKHKLTRNRPKKLTNKIALIMRFHLVTEQQMASRFLKRRAVQCLRRTLSGPTTPISRNLGACKHLDNLPRGTLAKQAPWPRLLHHGQHRAHDLNNLLPYFLNSFERKKWNLQLYLAILTNSRYHLSWRIFSAQNGSTTTILCLYDFYRDTRGSWRNLQTVLTL